ncbi:MAG: hypothetical protein KJ043_04495 [Anaerolineae bacterium]|nr:hypothetical protein [Anaerolineae bacterium]
MKLRTILIFVGLVFLIAACAPTPQLRSDRLLQDDSFVADPVEGCELPCWRGITPGETRWNDALNIIRDDTTLTSLQTRTDEATKQIGAAWAQTDGDNCCQMFSEDGQTVSFIVAQTTPRYRLGDVIEKHGEPSYIIGDTVSSDQALVSVYYPDVPMLIYVFVAGEAGQITDRSEVVGFAYLTSDLMTELLTTSNLHAWDGLDKTFNDYMQSDFELTPVPTAEATPES